MADYLVTGKKVFPARAGVKGIVAMLAGLLFSIPRESGG